MAKSTRSQDALLALVVLLTVFAVPALEVYVQLTHREDLWGPAVKGLFGLGVALSLGLGYRKWERDRTARTPASSTREHEPSTPPRPAPPSLPAPRSNASMHATAVIILAALAGALVGAYLFMTPTSKPRPATKPPTAPTVPTPTTTPTVDGEAQGVRLTFPGWQDLLIGSAAPADAVQRCERASSRPGERLDTCKGCRSAGLALPCVTVGLKNGVAWLVSAEIPDGEVAHVLAAIHAAWGQPTGHLRNNSLDSDCWYSARDHASYNAFKYDLSGVDLQDPNAHVPRARHPISTITISARDLIDNCDADGRPSTTDRAPIAEEKYDQWDQCMSEHCEGEKWAGEECQHTADEGVNLDEWCRDEWAAARKCSKQHCARFEAR